MAQYRWYVEPLDDFTWESILEGGLNITEDDVYYRRTCSDSEPHDVIEINAVDYEKVRRSVDKHPDFKARFWRQKGNGQLELWPPDSRMARRTRKARGKVQRGIPSGKAAQQ